MVLDALEMARWRRGTRSKGWSSFRCRVAIHVDSLWRELDELGAVPSIGSVGDAYDNALAETVNAAYKSELIRGPGPGPWRNVDDVELATLGWVHWFNTQRLHEYLGYVPPAEFEAAYAANKTDQELVGVI